MVNLTKEEVIKDIRQATQELEAWKAGKLFYDKLLMCETEKNNVERNTWYLKRDGYTDRIKQQEEQLITMKIILLRVIE